MVLVKDDEGAKLGMLAQRMEDDAPMDYTWRALG